MSRQYVQHYTRLLTRWPRDLLRPEPSRHFQALLKARIARPPSSDAVAHREVNAAYVLLDDAFTKQYPLPTALMKPASNPEHYTNLARELEEAPHRTWWGNFVKRMQNVVRFR